MRPSYLQPEDPIVNWKRTLLLGQSTMIQGRVGTPDRNKTLRTRLFGVLRYTWIGTGKELVTSSY